MKNLLPLVCLFCLLAISPGRAQQPDTPGWKLDKIETLPAVDGLTHHVQTLTRTGPAPSLLSPATATLHFVSFDLPRHTFAIYDQSTMGRANLGDIMTQHHALAGTNGGYFQPDFEPVGLLLAEGQLVSKPSRARLLSGALVVTGNHIGLRRSTDPLPGKNAHHAVQSGPFLVEFGKPLPGLNATRTARRTAVFTDGRLHWGLVSSNSLTLEELGTILSTPALLPNGLRIDKSLNLDGGSSTGLWTEQPGQSPFYIHELGLVRDFVGIIPRPATPLPVKK